MRNRRNTKALLLGSVLAVCSPILAAHATTQAETAEAANRQSTISQASVRPTSPGFAHNRVVQQIAYQTRGSVPRQSAGISCVPYARRVSGIELIGNAWQWWGNAEGHYARGRIPELGSVLAFRSNGRMRLGHVAVVSRIVNAREIEIDHANWGAKRGAITRGVAVVDVSPANNWTAVRVGLAGSADFGSVYPTHGFIYDRADNGILMVQDTAPAPTPALNPIPSDLRPAAERPWAMYEEVAEAPAHAAQPTSATQAVSDRR